MVGVEYVAGREMVSSGMVGFRSAQPLHSKKLVMIIH
jgi:hypothetical protein